MILKGESVAGGNGITLDDLFRRAGVRSPDAVALADPPNREHFTDGVPRTLTYAQADRAISALAARLHGLGLATDAVVAIQLANTVEAVITLLGVLRAGMIAAPLPLLWRQQDIVAALSPIGAKAIVTCARIGADAPASTAMLAAAELFPIRHICGFGRDLPDGVVALEEDDAPAVADFVAPPVRAGTAAAHVAVITFDVTAAGITPVARNHMQLIGGGLMAFLEAGMTQDAALLSAIPPASFAGIALAIVPWLFAGGSLSLHHGCDPPVLAAQCGALRDAISILPGPAVGPLAQAGTLAASIKTILALWRSPERLGADTPWTGGAAMVDVAGFGEVGLIAGRRGADGLPLPIPHGQIGAPRNAAGAVTVAATARGKAGTLLLQGPMVPPYVFPPGTDDERAAAQNPPGFVDTGFACRRAGDALIVTAPPAGLAAIGGYRVYRQAYEALVGSIDPTATVMAVPDAVTGERLVGHAADAQAVRNALQARGVNPLISGAFCPRGGAVAA
jgi:acyl-CoA synthetase (AMP-forming)/AMP-acid ligase II